MRPEALKLFVDMRMACDDVVQFVSGRTREDLDTDPMLRAAIERKLQIVGEALAQLFRVERTQAERISSAQRIVSFRNIVVHSYADLDMDLVWELIRSHLPSLRRELEAIIREAGQ